MHIAVEGCCHGELDKIYETLQNWEKRDGIKIELLLCCGDFQAVRDEADLFCMAVPDKYKSMQDFWQYYNGKKKAPYLTVFIGGNHEASNHLQELPYGGWVAPNIYYLGYAGVVTFKGVRIGGISGIFKWHDFNRGHFEKPPYNNSTKRSVYHVRSQEVFKLKLIDSGLDIMMSHDWPNGIANLGDTADLLRKKRYFEEDIRRGRLGSTPSMDLLNCLRPKHWFSGHLHVKFTASVHHDVPDGAKNPNKVTNFLALDKCLPKRDFLQVIDIETPEGAANQGLCYDAEWLAILKATDHFVSVSSQYVPLPSGPDCLNFQPSPEDIEEVKRLVNGDLSIPENFTREVTPLYDPKNHIRHKQVTCRTSLQTKEFCTKLAITDPLAASLSNCGGNLSFNTSSILLDEDDEMPSTIVSSTSINADEIDLGSDSEEEATTKKAAVESNIGNNTQNITSVTKHENNNGDVPTLLSSEEEKETKSPPVSGSSQGVTRLSLSLPPPIFGATSTPVRNSSDDNQQRTPDRDDYSPISMSTDSDYASSPVMSQSTPITSQARSRKVETPLARNALLASLRAKRLSDTESDLSESSSGTAPTVPRKFKRRNASLYSSPSEEDTN